MRNTRQAGRRTGLAIAALSLCALASGISVSGPSAPVAAAASTAATIQVSRTEVPLHGRVKISGTVPGGARPVIIERNLGADWYKVGAVKSSVKGHYEKTLTMSWLDFAALRIKAPATSRWAQSVSGVRSVNVTPTWQPQGHKENHVFLKPRSRWNPCQPIRYRLDTTLAPSGAAKDLATSMARVTEATGIRFTYVGTTTVDPTFGSTWPARTELVVSWRRSSWFHKHDLDHAAAIGGPRERKSSLNDAGNPETRTTRGYLVFEKEAYDIASTTRNGYVRLHELGHVMGLNHTLDGDQGGQQMMSPGRQGVPVQYGAGDLRGLRLLGKRQGCLS